MVGAVSMYLTDGLGPVTVSTRLWLSGQGRHCATATQWQAGSGRVLRVPCPTAGASVFSQRPEAGSGSLRLGCK